MGSITLTRCFNHGQREAVARCPSCRRHFCRECVTEHDHRMLCASCIAAATAVSEAPARRPLRLPIFPALQLSGALFVLWLFFFTLGRLLLMVPSQHHDALLWEPRLVDAEAPDDEPAPGDSDEGAPQ